MPARPFLLSGGQGLRSLPRRECWPCACVGTLACRCGPSLGGGARGRPGPALSGPSLGLSPVLLCAGHLGGSVEWQEHPGRSTGGDGACWGQCWRSAGRPAWDILAPFPSFQSRLSRLLESSASHSPAEVAALVAPARLGRVLLAPWRVSCVFSGAPSVLLKPSGSSFLLSFPWWCWL